MSWWYGGITHSMGGAGSRRGGVETLWVSTQAVVVVVKAKINNTRAGKEEKCTPVNKCTQLHSN